MEHSGGCFHRSSIVLPYPTPQPLEVEVNDRQPSTLCCTITPFTASGQLDEPAAAALFARLGAAGVGVYVGSSSPGEGYALSLDETERLYAVAHGTLKGKVAVRAMGVEPHTAEDLHALIELAERTDLDAMQLYCLDAGHANKPTESELESYFRNLLERMNIPAVLSSHIYNGYVLPADLVGRLLEDYPGIIGVNVTNPDLSYVARIIDTVDGRADVHVGGPMQALTALALGAQGYLGTEANLAPQLCASVITGFQKGDLGQTFDAYGKVIRLFSANTWPGGSMRWLKAAMRVLGLPGWALRAPWHPLSDGDMPVVAQRLADLAFAAEEGLAPPQWPPPQSA
jgi:4-hydroxy-tetrahydrodipicolinate synthase